MEHLRKRRGTRLPFALIYVSLLAFLSTCGPGLNLITTTTSSQSNPTALVYSSPFGAYLVNFSMSPNAPTQSFSGASFSINPSLPTGMSIDSGSGVISGTPTATTSITTYTVTANQGGNSFTTTLQLLTAQGYYVNNTTWGGGSFCTTNGSCDLQHAMSAATTSGYSAILILIAPGTYSTSTANFTTGPTGTPDLYVVGTGSSQTIIDGGGEYFALTSSTSLHSFTLANVTMQNFNDISNSGGAVYLPNSITGALTFAYDIFSNNQTNGSSAKQGGAISASGSVGSLSISNCTFSGNYAYSTTSGNATGGAIAFTSSSTSGAITISNSTFTNNYAQQPAHTGPAYGAAVYISSNAPTITISSSTFTGNAGYSSSLGCSGNALYFQGASGPATVSITNSSFSSNSCNAGTGSTQGGVIYLSPYGTSTITLDSNLFYSNSTSLTGATSGGVLYLNSGSSTFNISNDTFFNNSTSASSVQGGLLYVGSGATANIGFSTMLNNYTSTAANAVVYKNGTYNLYSSILVGNGTGSNCNSTAASVSYNYGDNNAIYCGTMSSITGINLASSLSSSASTVVQALALASSSNIIGAIPNSTVMGPFTCGSGVASHDSMGTSRPNAQDSGCDPGAFEY